MMLCRVYINVMDRKLLTAEKILGNAEALIFHIEVSRKLEIVTNCPSRQESKSYNIDILKKKYLLQNGILLASLNKPQDAQDSLLECIATGDSFDPRIRKECLSRLLEL